MKQAKRSATDPFETVRAVGLSLPDVEGRIDHMAVDIKGKRLFVAALGNNSVEVIDLSLPGEVERLRAELSHAP